MLTALVFETRALITKTQIRFIRAYVSVPGLGSSLRTFSERVTDGDVANTQSISFARQAQTQQRCG